MHRGFWEFWRLRGSLAGTGAVAVVGIAARVIAGSGTDSVAGSESLSTAVPAIMSSTSSPDVSLMV
jgi:hypothetical protein